MSDSRIHPTTSPDAATGTPSTDPATIPNLVAATRAEFDRGATHSLAWRRRQLLGIEALVVEREQELAAALADDLGKLPDEAFITELSQVRAEARTARRHLRRWLRSTPVAVPPALVPASARTRFEPLGLALIIAPWNYPVQLALSPLVGAVAAGNAVVLKPSELAPATSATLARLLPNYVDADAVQVVEGGVEESTALLAERWDTILYTGGGRVGRIVARAAAEHLTPTILELGGKSPCFVDGTVDLRTAADRIVWGKFMNAGQTCVAPDYLLVTDEIADRLVDELVASIARRFGASPLDSPDYGRIVSASHFERLSGMLGDGRVVTGGETDRARLRIAPTILSDVPDDAPLMQEEIFGPLLPVRRVRDADEAIAFIRARPKPLALYTFTDDRRVRRAFERRTSSGSLVEGMTLAQLAITGLPFGGVGESGMGAYHGLASLRAFSHEKAIVRKPLRPDTFALTYPPLDRTRASLLRRLL